MIFVQDSPRLSKKNSFWKIWLGKFGWAAHDFGYLNLVKYPPKLTDSATFCINSIMQHWIPPQLFAVVKFISKEAQNYQSWNILPKNGGNLGKICKIWPKICIFLRYHYESVFVCDRMVMTLHDDFLSTSWSNSGQLTSDFKNLPIWSPGGSIFGPKQPKGSFLGQKCSFR